MMMSKPLKTIDEHAPKDTISVVMHETSDPDVVAVTLKCVEQKVTKSKGFICGVDKSGSMQLEMTSRDSHPGYPYASTPTVPMAPSLSLAPMHTLSWSSVPPPALTQISSVMTPPPVSPSLVPLDSDTGVPLVPSLAQAFFHPPQPAAPPLNLLSRAISCGATPNANYQSYNNSESRLACVQGFLLRMLDLFIHMSTTQGLETDVTLLLFDDDCVPLSTHDGLTYEQIKERLVIEMQQNGGTNFEPMLQMIEQYKKKSSEEPLVIILSDGDHCTGKMTKAEIQEKYAKTANLVIGIGEEEQADLDKITLQSLSLEPIVIFSDPRKLRDLIGERTLGLVTMLGKDLKVKTIDDASHVSFSNLNMNESKEHCWSQMSMLTELYLTVSRGSNLELTYTLQDGAPMTTTFHATEDNLLGDTVFGDQIFFAMNLLKKLETAQSDIAEMSPKSKLDYLTELKKWATESEKLSLFKDTRLGIYVNHLQSQLERMLLTRNEREFMDLAQNVRLDAYRSTSSSSATAYSTPLAPACTPTLRATSSSTAANYNSKCVICTGVDSHREVVYVPCGHFMTCSGCSLENMKHSKQCPYCTQTVSGIILVSLSDEQKKDSWNMKCPSCNVRPAEIVSEECKHAFSCRSCMSKQKRDHQKVCCTICQTEVHKYVKVFM